jgi:multidrug efflux pump subunit AcrA (membrane-fusion protein)
VKPRKRWSKTRICSPEHRWTLTAIAVGGHATVFARQILDDQEELVLQDGGTIKKNQGTVQYDQVKVDFCHITAPIAGRMGLGLVDPGNVVQSAVQAAQIHLDIAMARCQTGLGFYLDVITARNTLLSDQQIQVTFRVSEMAAAVQLIQVLGGGWDVTQLPGHRRLRPKETPRQSANTQ